MTFIEVLQGIYYVSGIFLVGGVIFAGIQVNQSRKTAKIAAKRESYKLALEQSRFLSGTIIKQYMEISPKMKKEKLFMENVTISQSGNSLITNKDYNEMIEISNKIADDTKLSEKIINIMNNLESFALTFISGLAEEKIAFISNGELYTEIIEEMFYALTIQQESSSADVRMKLYFIWKERLEKRKLMENKIKLINQTKNIEKEIKNIEIKEKNIKPIGTSKK